VPNGADITDIPFTAGIERRRRRERLLRAMGAEPYRQIAMFVGSEHPPNVDAAEAIIDFAPELPNVLFLLVGGHCAPEA
jgi:hypothetical protein